MTEASAWQTRDCQSLDLALVGAAFPSSGNGNRPNGNTGVDMKPQTGFRNLGHDANLGVGAILVQHLRAS